MTYVALKITEPLAAPAGAGATDGTGAVVASCTGTEEASTTGTELTLAVTFIVGTMVAMMVEV